MAGTAIEWTDATWNPVTGCTKISAGCDNCYAERFSERFRGTPDHPFEQGFDLMLRPERLLAPLSWKSPKMIFVNSMSDLFHKKVPSQFVDRVFETMESREQTLAKHFILEKYLQSLAFKLLLGGYPTLTYVDGFSGPWESRTDDYSDTSFMIAIRVLKDAQAQLRAQGKSKTIRCFFVEEKAKAYFELNSAVMQHHDPASGFYVHTFHGKFEDTVDEIMKVVGASFALTFIDPTGWTGYEFDRIQRVMQHQPGEVLLTYMFDFINRFTAWDDPRITASFDGILGKDWRGRLNPSLPRHEAVQILFAEEFRQAGKFSYVLSTPIDKLSDRQHFSIVYGSRSPEGLATYREIEFAAMKAHGMRRHEAKQAIREAATGQTDIFATAGLAPPPPIEAQVKAFRVAAKDWLLDELLRERRAFPFKAVWQAMIETFMLRKTDAKQVGAELAKEGLIENTWRVGASRKTTPGEDDIIGLTPPSVTPGSDTAAAAG